MRINPRYFVVGSLLTLSTGLGVGLLAYSTGFQPGALAGSAGPDELRLVPASAALVAYADVHDIMASDLRQKMHATLPGRPDGQHEFQDATGINIETDIDHVVVAVVPAAAEPAAKGPGAVVVLARGRFDQVKIEALMREHGATVEDYKGARLVVADASQGHPGMSLAFLQPGLVAVGTSALIRSTVDLKDGGASVATNDELMGLVRDVRSGHAWAAGHFDVLAARATLPDGVAQQLPPVSLFSVSTRIDSGVRGTLRAETRDEQSATNLRDMVRGVLALAKVQGGTRPELGQALQSLQLGGDGRTVSLSFDLPASAIDAFAAMAPRRQAPASPQQ